MERDEYVVWITTRTIKPGTYGESLEARERYRVSDVEAVRQQAMAPFVEAESSGLYIGRELEIPKD